MLTGDSGIGKSALLARAQWLAEDALAPNPVQVYASDGAVQQALLDGLASAVAMLWEEPGRQRRTAVREFVGRMLEEGALEARRVVRQALIGQLRSHIGDEPLDLLRRIWGEAVVAGDAIGRRIAGARDSSVAAALTELAGEVLQLSERQDLLIAFDRLEVLPVGDVRLLSDIARMAPEGVKFRAAVMDAAPHGVAVVDTIRTSAGTDAALVAVPPLDEDGVRALLEHAGIDGALTPEVLRLTGGYPLHLGDVSLHLLRGGGIHNVPTHRNFGVVIERAWADIEASARHVARQLCLLERPLPLPALLEFLEVSDPAWWDTAERLCGIRVFTQQVDGIPWFHEQRRRWLLDHLAQQETRSYAARLVSVVSRLLADEPSGWRYSTTFAGLLEAAGDQIESPELRAIASLSKPALAVAGALLELTDVNEPAVEALSALDHTRHHFGVAGDLVTALSELEELDLAVVQSAGSRAAAVPLLDLGRVAAIAGFCQRRLGRMPIPGLATAIWDALLGPLAHPFEVAVYGVGGPAPGTLSRDVRDAQVRHTGVVSTRFHGCVAYGQHRGTRIYAAASTPTDEVDRLSNAWRGATVELADGTFTVLDVVDYPSQRFRSNRWLAAGTDVLGADEVRGGESTLELEADLRMHSRIREFAQEQMAHAERLAAGLRETAHYFFNEEEDASRVVEVYGLGPGVTRVPELRSTLHDAFSILRLADALRLSEGARIAHVTTSSGRTARSHPLRRFGEEMARQVLEYNREQPSLEVSLVCEELAPWLEALLEQRYADACRMHHAVGEDVAPPTKREVFIVTSPPSSSLDAAGPSACVAARAAEQSKVHYAVLRDEITGWGDADLIARFPEAEDLDMRWYRSVKRAIAQLAGYDPQDLSILRSLRALSPGTDSN